MGNNNVEQLCRAVREMSQGHFDELIPVGDDPVGELGHALRALSDEIQQRFAIQRTLLGVTADVNSGVLLEEVLDQIYDSFKELIPYDRIGCALIDKSGTEVVAHWVRSEASSLGIGSGYSARLSESSLAQVLETGEPRIINDLEQHYQERPSSEATRKILEEGVLSSLTCPLVAEGRPVGFLFFSSQKKHTYARAHSANYQQIASQVAVTVEKARLYQELLRTKDKLLVANKKLQEMANVDGLTQVANRRLFDTIFEREWQRGLRNASWLSLVMVDVDHFKRFNDRYGHISGDVCLQRIAQALSHRARRATDLVARYGGEEFVIVLPELRVVEATRMATQLRSSVEALKIAHETSSVKTRTVTVSLGVAAVLPTRDGDPQKLIELADQALYQAKERGRNCVVTLELPEPEAS